MSIIVEGLVWGLVLSLFAGPIFIALIQLGIERGIRAGMALSSGVLLSDIFYITIVYLGMSQFEDTYAFEYYGSIVGGLILIAFGFGTFISKYKAVETIEITAATYFGYFVKGVTLNVSNPFVLFLWIGVTKKVIQDGYDLSHRLSFVIALLAAVLITDFLKLVLAKKIRKYMKEKHFIWLRKTAGIGLILFGIALMIRGTVQ